MKLIYWIIDKWWLPYVLSAGMIAIWLIAIFLLYTLPQSDVVIYIWVFEDVRLALLLPPLVATVTSTLLYMMKKGSILKGLLLLLPFVCALVMIRPMLSQDKPRLAHIGTVTLSGRVYNLARFTSSEIPNYVFYECDKYSFYCHAIYRYRIDAWSEDDDLNPPYIAAAEQNVAFYVRGEPIYQYSTPSAES